LKPTCKIPATRLELTVMPKQTVKTTMEALLALGQSVWLDYLSRGMTRSGGLQALIDDGLRGMTSNPTIFEHALKQSNDYDAALSVLASSSRTDRELFETLAIADVREAADLFRPIYNSTDGGDGFVSLEVSPRLAHDTDGSVAEARRLWKALDRPNVMIKIPGTREGWPAIERCLEEGININITLLFSVQHYHAVADAYIRALEARVARGRPVDKVASVASFFVSRVDTEIDKRIQAQGGPFLELRGQVAVASAHVAYATFLAITRTERWRALEARGAKPQRLLWASMGTKNPEYSDVLYVNSLIGRHTITTVPPDTLRLFVHHGTISQTLSDDNASHAQRLINALGRRGIDFADVNHTLEEAGIKKFIKSFDNLIDAIARKRRALQHGYVAS
jgi:transaldolase